MSASTAEYRVISIGTLPSHPLWQEPANVRTGHATTTLVETGSVRLVIDPGLPPTALAARLSERTGGRPDGVTHVFLTSFTFDHYRGAALFPSAEWLIHEPEREAARNMLQREREEAEDAGDRELVELIDAQRGLLEQCRPADDAITPGVDLFPLPGVTPGTCGVLLPLPRHTVLVCGDAVATSEHLSEGKVLPGCDDIETAMASFREAIEIADVLVPGRDNIVFNPLRSMG